MASGRVTFGRGTYGSPTVKAFQHDDVTRLVVGSYTSIAPEVTFLLGGEHNTGWVTTFPMRIVGSLPGAGRDGHPASRGDIVVGSDVWLGWGALILSGVTIGDGAVVGARAVVARDVPPYGIVLGNPARLARFRFDEPIREALLRIRWWDWEPERVTAAVARLCSDDVEGFVREYDPGP
jgi:acetyltransferase-like isoleucine patch superfamily enzyme